MKRKCNRCGAEISDCNGFVKIGDFLEIIVGTRKKEDGVRELCGKCALLFIDASPEQISQAF